MMEFFHDKVQSLIVESKQQKYLACIKGSQRERREHWS